MDTVLKGVVSVFVCVCARVVCMCVPVCVRTYIHVVLVYMWEFLTNHCKFTSMSVNR